MGIDNTVLCLLKLVNSLIFVILNWGEVIGFAGLFWMVRNIKNELNVKREVQVVLILWGIFSVIYFSFQLALQQTPINDGNIGYRYGIRYSIFVAI